MKFSDEQDQQLTAYALGELEGAERAAVEAMLRENPAARAAVEEIRATAAQLEAALADEPLTQRAVPAADPYKPAKRGVLRFPEIYYVVGGLAAACFAVVVALHEPRQAVSEGTAKKYVTVPVNLPAVRSGTESPTIQLPANLVAGVADGAAATAPGPFDFAQGGLLEQSRKLPASSAPLLLAMPDPNQRIAGNSAAVVLPELDSHAMVRREARDAAVTYAALNREAESRARTDLRDVASAVKRIDPPFLHSVGGAAGFARAGLVVNLADTESYSYRRESDFLSVRENPLSTFSADVDTASYANVRRFIGEGRRPPIDAVRIEEMVNYFPYRYAAPHGGPGEAAAPFAATMEVAEAPWAPEHRLVRIGLKSRDVATPERAAANLVFLLDVSGSMSAANKLPLVKESMRLLLGRLRADDRVAIVTYAGATGLALPSTPVAKKREIDAAIEALSPGGGTNGAMGIQLAYDIAKANFVSEGINRVILCTDGDFNVGVTSEGELVRLIEEKAKSGVFLTVLGFGMGNLKDSMLQQVADRGNGSYGYVDTRREAEKLLDEQVNGTLVTVAKDVKLQVEFNPTKVAKYRLLGYEKRLLAKEDFNNDAIDAGEIGAGHTVTALYEIVPVPAAGRAEGERNDGEAASVDELRYRVVAAEKVEVRTAVIGAENELLTLKIRYKEPAGVVSRKLEFSLTDAGATFAEASEDFKFAAAVAGFGMLLRDSQHKGAATFANVAAWAEAGAGSDAGGYRAEFVDLVRRAGAL